MNAKTTEITRLKQKHELDLQHVDTKNRLLTEALNKRNEDVGALENGNEDLINLLEKCDDKIQKLDEDYRVEKMKTEQYEKELDEKGKGHKKIDVESLDGRINFLVSTLEEYRRILEQSEFGSEHIPNPTQNSVLNTSNLLDDSNTPKRIARSLCQLQQLEKQNTLNTGTMSSDQ